MSNSSLIRKTNGLLQILLGASFFGLIPIFVRYGKDIGTLNLVFFRALFGALAILVYIWISGRKLILPKKYIKKTAVQSLILLLAITSYFFSLKKVDIATATLLLSLNSAFIVIFSVILLKEKFLKKTMLSLFLSTIGVVLLIGDSGIFQSNNLIGYACGISAAFWTGLNFVYPLIHLKQLDSYSLVFFQGLFQLPFLFIFLFFYPPVINGNNMLIFGGLGIFCTAIAFTLIYNGSKKVKSQLIGVYLTAEFLVPIILACILFREIPTLNKIIGGIVLIAAYLIVLFTPKSDTRLAN